MYGSSRRALLLATIVGVAVLAACSPTASDPARAEVQQEDGYVVVNTFPHDPHAYTQGLAFHRTRFYEGTGLNGESSLRRVDLETGEVEKKVDLPAKYFGEGVTLIGDRIYQITWQEERAFVYDVATFKRLKTFNYSTSDDSTEEGWGLADNGRKLAMSDGTEIIRFRKPKTFEVTREIRVTENGTPVFRLNELEWIGDEIFANLFGLDDVVRIDPKTGEVTGKFNLEALRLREEAECDDPPEVTNGIAYLQSEDRFFVTGKNWCHIYEIELTDPPGVG